MFLRGVKELGCLVSMASHTIRSLTHAGSILDIKISEIQIEDKKQCGETRE
jgi:hypothetical protein